MLFCQTQPIKVTRRRITFVFHAHFCILASNCISLHLVGNRYKLFQPTQIQMKGWSLIILSASLWFFNGTGYFKVYYCRLRVSWSFGIAVYPCSGNIWMKRTDDDFAFWAQGFTGFADFQFAHERKVWDSHRLLLIIGSCNMRARSDGHHI